jgi:hypothetical protein
MHYWILCVLQRELRYYTPSPPLPYSYNNPIVHSPNVFPRLKKRKISEAEKRAFLKEEDFSLAVPEESHKACGLVTKFGTEVSTPL